MKRSRSDYNLSVLYRPDGITSKRVKVCTGKPSVSGFLVKEWGSAIIRGEISSQNEMGPLSPIISTPYQAFGIYPIKLITNLIIHG